jgi:hypothetical protein
MFIEASTMLKVEPFGSGIEYANLELPKAVLRLGPL